MNSVIREPNEQEFEQVKKHIEEFWLDNTDLRKEQFLVLLRQNELIGFGRLRVSADAAELCTLGVVTQFQKKGFGREMVKALVKKADGTVYAVCIIPEFFLKLGFTQVSEYPPSIAKKYNLCVTEYAVPEPYVVMKYV